MGTIPHKYRARLRSRAHQIRWEAPHNRHQRASHRRVQVSRVRIPAILTLLTCGCHPYPTGSAFFPFFPFGYWLSRPSATGSRDLAHSSPSDKMAPAHHRGQVSRVSMAAATGSRDLAHSSPSDTMAPAQHRGHSWRTSVPISPTSASVGDRRFTNCTTRSLYLWEQYYLWETGRSLLYGVTVGLYLWRVTDRSHRHSANHRVHVSSWIHPHPTDLTQILRMNVLLPHMAACPYVNSTVALPHTDCGGGGGGDGGGGG